MSTGDDGEDDRRRSSFALLLAKVITGLWVLSLILDFAVPSYTAPKEISVLMMAAAGFAFGTDLVNRK